MINHTAIIEDLKRKELKQGEIAKKHNCSRETVVRIARQNNIKNGRGKIQFWEFDECSIDLAYILGMYITDGYIIKTKNGVVISSITKELIDHLEMCMRAIDLNPKINYQDRDSSRQRMYQIASYNSEFARWVYEVCQHKARIPEFIFSAPPEQIIAFIAGAIDGDGSIDKEGCISIGEMDNWLHDLPALLDKLNIRHGDLRVEAITDSDKPFYDLSIRRADYVASGGYCIHPKKQDRLMNAKCKRGKPCPKCGEYMARPNANQCRACYRLDHK